MTEITQNASFYSSFKRNLIQIQLDLLMLRCFQHQFTAPFHSTQRTRAMSSNPMEKLISTVNKLQVRALTRHLSD